MTTEDEVVKCYRAGQITGKGTLTIFGICAERGTFGQFANLTMLGMPFIESIVALTTFTEYVNEAIQNEGITDNKQQFKLTQRDKEIIPLLENLGVVDIFHDKWAEVKEYDKTNNMKEQMPKYGVLEGWKEKTKRIDVPLKQHDAEIACHVIKELVAFNPTTNQDILINAFMEGQKGLTLGNADQLQSLMDGRSILARSRAA
jgi:hypothetical protein